MKIFKILVLPILLLSMTEGCGSLAPLQEISTRDVNRQTSSRFMFPSDKSANLIFISNSSQYFCRVMAQSFGLSDANYRMEPGSWIVLISLVRSGDRNFDGDGHLPIYCYNGRDFKTGFVGIVRFDISLRGHTWKEYRDREYGDVLEITEFSPQWEPFPPGEEPWPERLTRIHKLELRLYRKSG